MISQDNQWKARYCRNKKCPYAAQTEYGTRLDNGTERCKVCGKYRQTINKQQEVKS